MFSKLAFIASLSAFEIHSVFLIGFKDELYW